ncbi:hypothetical protein CALCODRAFT_372421 [Calocera cornea HHB12733]|uniref:Hook C-terminal domain-containing protein n=1 Tax=Calocera cornea HHB12733 TaxID=1353952 RepID=A0A165EGU1_9BASI|nr:hypothetical protein CALCODRAFT_372421 [Calocera cornea HHB12733]
MYKDRCEFLTKELFESDPVPHHTDSNQHSGGGAERVVSAYAASGAPASQEELEALFSGSNTNSTQEELVTLRSQLDVVAAERDELKVSLALVQGTEANLRAELETKTVAVERLSEDVSRHAKRAQEYESDADLLRQVYAAASSSAAERKQEADELRQQNAILRGQVKDGVAGAKLFAQARVGALQADVKKWRAMAELQLKRADRSELVEIREKAAKEPVLQKRIRALKVQVQELEQENEELDRQVKTARAERLIERPMEEERRRREAMQMGADDGLADFEPDDMVYRCEWWETLNERCRAVYRTKGVSTSLPWPPYRS